ncbi:hypothetical protein DXT76_01055 [Halobacillus trueperi]|uniref:Uncharacterized protein n=1 Tax=Halobacillus trueperi TaxID=156205 RepID=A0A3D8VSP2_9BACI|nr:hypothetical protein [Halobacillus trueperi]RDY72559.1 hypothetical protein DXT76_01055 [Halobacillus trueperi]
MSKIRFFSKYKWTLLVTVGGVIVLVLPILINQLMRFNWFKVVGDEETWISFYGSYLGGITGGLMTLVGVLLTLNHQRKNKEQEDNIEEHRTLLLLYPKLLLTISNLKNIKFSLDNFHLMLVQDDDLNWIERKLFKSRVESLSEKVNFLEEIDTTKLSPATLTKLMEARDVLNDTYVYVSALEGNFNSGFLPDSWGEYSLRVSETIDYIYNLINELDIRK